MHSAGPNWNMTTTASDRRRGPGGFTLLEVMVALAVVSLGMLAAFTTISQSTTNAIRLQDKTMANWIALNRLAEMRLEDKFPDTGRADGDVEFAGAQWRWYTEVSDTEVEALRRVDVTVARAETPDIIAVKVSGFLGQPQPEGVPVTPWTGGQQPGAPGDGDGDDDDNGDDRRGRS